MDSIAVISFVLFSIFILLEAGIPDDCVVDGITYKDGQSWINPSDPCDHCNCNAGNHECFIQGCPAPPCENYRVREGTCCDWICDGSCIVGGITYKDGESWINPDDPCDHCNCMAGKPQCFIRDCEEPPCRNYIRKEGTCCEVICQGTCDVGGITYNDGDYWINPNNLCDRCNCYEGEVQCKMQKCPAAPCANYRVREGTCCDWICDGLPKLRKGCPRPYFGPDCIGFRLTRFCKNDIDCESHQKCCEYDCGSSQCIEILMKPGVCPKVNSNSQCTHQDDIQCVWDGECKGRNLCCATTCGGFACKEPAGPSEVRLGCPFPPRPIEEAICTAIPPETNCKRDTDCLKPDICCNDECGNVLCKHPAAEKPGKCPPILQISCKRADIIRCGIDEDCRGKRKCCPTACTGSSCLRPIKCTNNKKWRATVTYNKIQCKNCSCKKLNKKHKVLLEHACKNNISDVRNNCCKSCKNFFLSK